MSMTVTAQFHGTCTECDDNIIPGQRIEPDNDGSWQHATCGAMPARVECVCEKCMLVHTGECF